MFSLQVPMNNCFGLVKIVLSCCFFITLAPTPMHPDIKNCLFNVVLGLAKLSLSLLPLVYEGTSLNK